MAINDFSQKCKLLAQNPLFLRLSMYIKRMEGLLLIIFAFALIIAEAHVPSFGILGIAGIISLLAGGHFIIEQGGIFGYQLEWPFFLGLATATAIPLFFASYVVAKYRNKKPVAGVEGMIGHDAKIIDWSGKSGRVHVQGELWAAQSTHEHSFAEGDIVTIANVQDMSLHIHPKN
jgi:membrane-bound serine protease (ClpP class)